MLSESAQSIRNIQVSISYDQSGISFMGSISESVSKGCSQARRHGSWSASSRPLCNFQCLLLLLAVRKITAPVTCACPLVLSKHAEHSCRCFMLFSSESLWKGYLIFSPDSGNAHYGKVALDPSRSCSRLSSCMKEGVMCQGFGVCCGDITIRRQCRYVVLCIVLWLKLRKRSSL